MRTFGLIAALGIILAPVLASAHPVPGSLSGNPFHILDRPDPHNNFGVDLGIGGIAGDESGEDPLFVRFDLNGQALVGPSLGLFASIPISAIFNTMEDPFTGEDNDVVALGNIDAGLFFFSPVGGGHTYLVARGSLTLPTASDELDGFVANFLGSSMARVTDIILTFPEQIAFRGSASLIHDAPGLTLRFDGGLDFPLATTIDDVEIEHDPIIRLNAGAAIGSGPTRFVAEIANTANAESLDDEDGEFINQLALGLTTQQGQLLLGASFSVLLDSVVEEEDDGVLFGVLLSASTTF